MTSSFTPPLPFPFHFASKISQKTKPLYTKQKSAAMMRRGTDIEMKKREDEDLDEIMKTAKDPQKRKQKPPFRPAEDDTKPVLRDPILRSDPIETEEVFLRLPPFPPLPRS